MKTSIVEKQVDALIKRGYYPNRAEFIDDAIRAFFERRKEMKIAAAVELYKKEEVSISKAAELAGLNIEEVKRVLADKGIERGLHEKQKNCSPCTFTDDAMTVIDTCVLSSLLKKRVFYEFFDNDKRELFSYFELKGER